MPDRPDIKPKKAYVYFARSYPTGMIKIGCSIQPDQRAQSLKYEFGEPIKILFTVPGGFDVERKYHRRFRASRYQGEWFYESEKLHDFLKSRGFGGTRTVIEKQVRIQPGPGQVIEVLKPVFVEKIALSSGPRPLLVGYARVSTNEQNLDVQISALRDAGVTDENLFVEKLSALNSKRPMFHLALKFLERGDTLIVHSLSRLGRDVKQLHEILSALDAEGIAWRSLTEPHLNNSTASGRLMLNITGAMAQFERDQIKDRTQRGMDELKRKGVPLGRPEKISDADAKAMVAMRKKGMTCEAIKSAFSHLGISVSAIYARTNELMRKKRKAA